MLTTRTQYISMNREVLLEKIKENYQIYLQELKETQKDYEDLVRSFAARLNDKIRQGIFHKDFIYFNTNPPINYSEKYETVIEMLEYSTSHDIELDQSAFKSYVKNQWDWTENFKQYSASLKGMY